MGAGFSFHFDGLRCWVFCPSTVMERHPTKSFRSSGEQSTEGEAPRHLLIEESSLNATEGEGRGRRRRRGVGGREGDNDEEQELDKPAK
jgi:hypothetical protein